MSMIGNLRRLPDRRLRELIADSREAEEYFEEDEAPNTSLDLDKEWHGLHFLLTGTAWEGSPPLDFIVRGGQELDIDSGYGPPRAFVATEVAALSRALAPLTRDTLAPRFQPNAMTAAEIYPTIWDRADEHDDNKRYLLDTFERVKAFVDAAATAEEGLLVYLT